MTKIYTEEITDLNVAAFLIVSGFKLLRPPRLSHNKKFRIFDFERTQELEEMCTRYFNRNAMVDALTLAETTRSLFASSKSQRDEKND